MNTSTAMKIFMITDCEWWIGADADSVRQAVKDDCGYSDEDLEDFSEVEADGLDNLKYTDCDEDERPIGEPRTFREQLAIEVEAGGEFPRLFAVEPW
jgi:hypothetical protein